MVSWHNASKLQLNNEVYCEDYCRDNTLKWLCQGFSGWG